MSGGSKQAFARFAVALVVALMGAGAAAEVRERVVDYRDGGESLRGYLYFDDAVSGARPGVLVVHEWWGLNDYARGRARKLAEAGYVALAVDMYGVGKVTRHPDEARAFAGAVTANVEGWRRRAEQALDQLVASDLVDPDRLAAIGYCFGGATVLQLAYAGAPLAAVVSFHGSLPTPTAVEAAAIKGAVLIEHGASDAFIPPDRIAATQAALEQAGVDWQMDYHSAAVHGFTNPDADAHGMPGVAYNARADRRSWAAMQRLFAEKFAR